MSGYRCCEHCAQVAHHEPWADGHDIPCGVHQCHGADWLRVPALLSTDDLATLRDRHVHELTPEEES